MPSEAKYKLGERIRLVKMGEDDPNPIEPGTTGEIIHLQYISSWQETHLMVRWDNGRTLGVVLSERQVIDVVEKI